MASPRKPAQRGQEDLLDEILVDRAVRHEPLEREGVSEIGW